MQLQKKQFELKNIFPVIPPKKALDKFIANDVDYISIDNLKGKIAATLILVYPPGIASVVPGERFDKKNCPQISYFKMVEEMHNLFPGFENEVQGLFPEEDEYGKIKYYTYVIKDKK